MDFPSVAHKEAVALASHDVDALAFPFGLDVVDLSNALAPHNAIALCGGGALSDAAAFALDATRRWDHFLLLHLRRIVLFALEIVVLLSPCPSLMLP